MTVSQIYEKTIKPLPEAERREMATLILADIPSPPVTEYGGEWSEEDMRGLTAVLAGLRADSLPGGCGAV